MSLLTACVTQIRPLTDSIIQLFITPDIYRDYQAGQYLDILIEEEAISFSIANAPLGSHQYELHIRHSRGNVSNQKLFSQIKEQGMLSLQLPFGNCHLDYLSPDKPILFIAWGTGFAPVKAMIEQLLVSDDLRPFELVWGARSQSDLYMDEKVKQWQNHVARFNYHSLISEDKNSLASALLNRYQSNINTYQIVLSGPFDMVYGIRDTLVKQGVTLSAMYSDAFSFEQKGGN